MTRKPRYHRKGSVVVMVVGLLVLLAMVGTTFIIVAHMDRRESRSIATVAPMKQVADGVLQQIRVKLAEDLYIDAAGVIYGSAADYKQQADCPHEDYDKHLASFAPVDVDGDGVADTWKHISNHNSAAGFADVPADDTLLLLVDTDGYFNDGTNAGDAKLFPSGVSNRSGQTYWVAVRIIDASSLMNVNSTYSSTTDAAAAAGVVMPVTNIALDVLINTATRDSVHNTRRGDTATDIANYNTRYIVRPLNPNPPGGTAFLPFDAGDFLTLAWGGTVPNTRTGRLFEALGAYAQPPTDRRPYLTVHSASRDYIRRASGIQDTTHRVNLNGANLSDLFKAFYNTIPLGIAGFTPDINARRIVAAQLAINVIDFQDSNNNVTVAELNAAGNISLDDEIAPVGTIIYGIERQPFVTELFYKVYKVSELPDVFNRYSAIEIFNPYATAINMSGFRLTQGTNEKTTGWPNSISPGKRVVIVSASSAIPVHADAEHIVEIPWLDLDKGVKIYRSRNGDGTGTRDVMLADVTLTVDNPAVGEANSRVLQWDDAVADAKYSLDVSNSFDRDYTNASVGGLATTDNTNLGRPNDNYGCADVTNAKPCPIFVRNGNFINLGELSRIFFVGPSDSASLSSKLTAKTHISNGRLYTFGTIKAGTDPQIPPICMLGDYIDVLTPDPNNIGRTDTVYGRININTAPWQVIQYLPGIASLPTQAQRELVAKDIVAYRDLLNNTGGGHNYSAAGARATVTALADLRPDAGFASTGEIAIPLAKIVTLPNNTYGASAPNCYTVADGGASDDGLNQITGDLSKHDIYYSWLSNQITVRSDVYIAYIRVQIGSDAATTGAVRKYVAVIDRSNCTLSTHLPRVLMFAELK